MGLETNENIVLEYLSDALFEFKSKEIALLSDYEICGFLNAKIHNDIERSNFSVSNDGADVLRERKAVCGGMVIALKCLLEELGFDSALAYMIGGNVAHSMLEVDFKFGSVVFDPYFGVVFREKDSLLPLSINEAIEAIARNDAVVYFANKSSFETHKANFEDVYSIEDTDNRIDYDFPGEYLQLEGWGTANSGFVDFVKIDLHLDKVLGNKEWTAPSDKEPFPYTSLANTRRDDGRHLSWGYIMGQTGIGYHVQHIYKISSLNKKKLGDFILRIGVCTSYAKTGHSPVITFQQILGGNTRICKKLENRNSDGDGDGMFKPQILEALFQNVDSQAIIICHAFGDFVLSFIEIEKV